MRTRKRGGLREEQGVVDTGDLGDAEKRGKATRERRQNPAAYGEAQRTLRRAIRRAKKTCWDNFVQGADKKQLWRAVRYTAPRLDCKVLHRTSGLLHPRGVVLLEGHLGVHPDSEPPRGVLIEGDFVLPDSYRFRGFPPSLGQKHGLHLCVVEGYPVDLPSPALPTPPCPMPPPLPYPTSLPPTMPHCPRTRDPGCPGMLPPHSRRPQTDMP